MRKYISINCLILLIIFTNLTFYVLFFKPNDNEKLNQREGKDLQIKSNGIHSPINITGNNDFTPSNGVSFGDGSYENPYIIEDLIIEVDGPKNCIFINNTDVYFKIQNCTLKNSGSAIDKTVIRFNNVSNGLIVDNIINLAGIFLTNSHNNLISNNNFKINSSIFLNFSDNNTISENILINCTNIHFLFSNNNEILNNYIRNCLVGIKFQYSDNNTVKWNEIYDCKDYGIGIWSESDNNQIIENYIYNNGNKTDADQIDIDFDSIGTIISGNVYAYRSVMGIPWLILFIIVFIIIISSVVASVVIFLLYRRYRKMKEYKHPEPSEPVDTSNLW